MIDDRLLRKAKRIAMSRYHPDKYNYLLTSTENEEQQLMMYNRILEISK
jgi:hypothetical protein